MVTQGKIAVLRTQSFGPRAHGRPFGKRPAEAGAKWDSESAGAHGVWGTRGAGEDTGRVGLGAARAPLTASSPGGREGGAEVGARGVCSGRGGGEAGRRRLRRQSSSRHPQALRDPGARPTPGAPTSGGCGSAWRSRGAALLGLDSFQL